MSWRKGGTLIIDDEPVAGDAAWLVLLDMVMPEMGGAECLGIPKQIDPEICVVITSGFTPDADLSTPDQQGRFDFLGKAYSRRDLATLVSRAIERVRAGEQQSWPQVWP